MNQLNYRLKEFREGKGWSKAALAKRLGISPQLYGQYERDEAPKMPGADFLLKWKEVFGKDIFENETKVSIEAMPPDENYSRLVRSMENLTEDKIRSTAIIERLVALLEQGLSFGPSGKVAPVQPASNTQADDPAFEDLKLGRNIAPANKGRKS